MPRPVGGNLSHHYRVETRTDIPFEQGSGLIAREIATHLPLYVLNDQLWAHNQAGIEERVSRELGIEPRPRPNPFPKG